MPTSRPNAFALHNWKYSTSGGKQRWMLNTPYVSLLISAPLVHKPGEFVYRLVGQIWGGEKHGWGDYDHIGGYVSANVAARHAAKYARERSIEMKTEMKVGSRAKCACKPAGRQAVNKPQFLPGTFRVMYGHEGKTVGLGGAPLVIRARSMAESKTRAIEYYNQWYAGVDGNKRITSLPLGTKVVKVYAAKRIPAAGDGPAWEWSNSFGPKIAHSAAVLHDAGRGVYTYNDAANAARDIRGQIDAARTAAGVTLADVNLAIRRGGLVPSELARVVKRWGVKLSEDWMRGWK